MIYDHHFCMEHINNSSEPISTTWIENLAIEEINMDESGIVNLDDHLNPIHLLEESSIDFMNQLRDRFEIYVDKFNEYRGTPQSGAQIKIFKISNTINDFMLFRNALRLIIARKANDLISIGFISNGAEVFSARLKPNDSTGAMGTHNIKAHIGAFNKIQWLFDNQEVEVDSLVRHYLSEFIKQSAR